MTMDNPSDTNRVRRGIFLSSDRSAASKRDPPGPLLAGYHNARLAAGTEEFIYIFRGSRQRLHLDGQQGNSENDGHRQAYP